LVGGADQGRFQIDATTGVLAFMVPPDFENPTDSDHNNSYIVQVGVSDGSLTDTQTITVNVTDVAPVFTGDNGDNTFTSTSENDTFLGLGGTDTVIYGGLHTQYEVEIGLTGTLRVIDLRPGSPDNTDTLSSIERLQFADGVFSTDDLKFNVLGSMPGWKALSGDFNGDGTTDLLWNNGAAGVLGTWLIKDGHIAGTVALNHNMPGWTALVGDFNGD